MSRIIGAILLLVASAVPAAAASITIDSTNCNNSSGSCFGLSWTLNVISGSFVDGTDTYEYQATLAVTDDPLVSGTPDAVISAVAFKASNSIDDAALVSSPANSGSWSTSLHNLSSGGCTGSGSGFVCSSTSTNPAEFGSLTTLVWTWYFNTDDTSVADVGDTLKIGAKVTTLSQPGKLLSVHATVPEPASLSLLGLGLVVVAGWARRSARPA